MSLGKALRGPDTGSLHLVCSEEWDKHKSRSHKRRPILDVTRQSTTPASPTTYRKHQMHSLPRSHQQADQYAVALLGRL